MKTRQIHYAAALIAFSASVSGCGPSKEAMCEKINASRTVASDTKADQEYSYVRCLQADDAYVKKLYNELIEKEKHK